MTQLTNDCFKNNKKRISLEKAVLILQKKNKMHKKNSKNKTKFSTWKNFI